MSPLWRATSFRTTAGQPMTIRRALALNAVLEQCDLPHVPGDLLACNAHGRKFAADPATAAERQDALALLKEIGERDFGSHRDHHAPDYARLLSSGLAGLRTETEHALAQHAETDQRAFLQSVIVALDGVTAFARRWSRRLADLAQADTEFGVLLGAQARLLAELATEPAHTFHGAVQLTVLLHECYRLDDRYAMALGRLDQFLYPYYRADLAAGRITADDAQAILDHLFAKLTSNDEDVQNIALGGVTPAGEDATNELSYMILEACRRVGKVGGNCTARIHAKTPPAFIEKCAEVIRTGIGYPAVFNDEVEIRGLVEQGYPLEEARDYCFVGCIECFLPGRMAPWADSRSNPLYCLNLVVWNGVDVVKGEKVGLETGEPATWDEFWQAFLAQLRHYLRNHVNWLNTHKAAFDRRAADFTSPLLSALTRDCIARGRDLNNGGARHPGNHGVAGMGIGVTADSLMAIRKFVYEQKRFSLDDLRRMLAVNFEGFEKERLLLLRGAPKYGNANTEVDQLAHDVTEAFARELFQYRTPQGGHFWGLMGSNVSNIYGGMEVGASADGRLAGQPLSDAASPTFGRDEDGPTAVIRSVASLPYHLCPGGNVVNMKLHPSALRGDAGLKALAHLIRACFDMGGIELQFNTIDREVLKQAMEKPQEYRGLVVRVSGFSAHYTNLQRLVQEDILARTEHSEID